MNAVASSSGPQRSKLRRTIRVIFVLGLALVIVSGAYVGYVAIRAAQPVALPSPAGPYGRPHHP